MKQEKIKIRKGVFETNSSSMHSICFSGENNFTEYDSPIYVEFGEFGWGYDELNTAQEKLSYVLTYISECYSYEVEDFQSIKYYIWLNEMVKDYTGFSIVFNEKERGFIDHQSMDTISDHWSEEEYEFKNKMKDLIFNRAYVIIIDHDNH